ncbi:MAG: MFS transporter [Dinoroseobacter sp.]|nr:MFS transporter [Dinoroseobacter sp.]
MTKSTNSIFTPVLIGGSIILMVGFAIRASFGVFQIPIAEDFSWPRAEFSLAIAIQNLFWGIGQPLFSAIGERFGDRRAIILGSFCYAVGLVFMTLSATPGSMQAVNMLIGFGVAGMGFGVILAMVGRAASDKHRSLALGLATAAGSLGQVVGPPFAEVLLRSYQWETVILIFAAISLAALVFLPMMRAPEMASKAELQDSMGTVLRRAFKDPSYTMIFLGFFSCGYQLGFTTAHFPAFVTELCGPIDPNGVLAGLGITTTSALGAVALGLVGLANIVGTIYAGYLGNFFPRKYLLALIYTGRTIAAAVFILMPITPASVIVFSLVMGALWLATVPLTSGLVAHLYGLRYMGTLYGVVFFSHQVGGFLGVWLGGRLYDIYGDYTLVWWIGVGVGAFSALVHLPIRENRDDQGLPSAA